MKRTFSLSALALLALTVVSGHRACAQSYTYVDAGNASDPGQYGGSLMNGSGQVAGSISFGSGLNAFRITPLVNSSGQPSTWYQDTNNDGINDLMTLFSPPSGYTGAWTHAINASGQMAGETRQTQQAFFIDTTGPVQVITKTHSAAYSINDQGVLAGWAYTNNGQYINAATWQKTVTRKGTTWTQTLLGTPAPYLTSQAFAINNDGAVVAGAGNNTVPTVWLPSALYGLAQGWNILPTPSGQSGMVNAINNQGQMAGYSNGHAVLWLPQSAYGLPVGVLDLNPVGSVYTDSFPCGLNNGPHGVLSVVGFMDDRVSVQVPFLWRSDTQQAIDLTTVTSGLPTGWMMVQANAINDAGLIFGISKPTGNYSGPARMFVLVPNP